MKHLLYLLLLTALTLPILAMPACSRPTPAPAPDEPTPDEPLSEKPLPNEPVPDEPSVPYINEDNLAHIVEPTTDFLDDAAFRRATQYNNRADLTRLMAVMNRAKAGEDITVAVIGGSITAGTAASNTSATSYAAHFRNWWTDTFPKANIKLVNAGIGATTSYLGVHRVQKDVIDKGADLCVVEFSVNDYGDGYFTQTYESLIARLLDNDIAVLLLFMVKQDGTSTQQSNVTSGIKMAVPMISYGDAIKPMLEAGELSWEDISPDNIHPNDRGHAMAGELIWEYLNEVFATCPDEVTVTPMREELLSGTKYFNSRLLDSTTLTPDVVEGFAPTAQSYSSYQNGWRTENGGVIEFTATFSRMGAMYRKAVDGTAGRCEVYVDGKLVATLDGDYSGGWGDYDRTDQFFSSRKVEQHTVRLVAEEGKVFTLVRLLIAE